MVESSDSPMKGNSPSPPRDRVIKRGGASQMPLPNSSAQVAQASPPTLLPRQPCGKCLRQVHPPHWRHLEEGGKGRSGSRMCLPGCALLPESEPGYLSFPPSGVGKVCAQICFGKNVQKQELFTEVWQDSSWERPPGHTDCPAVPLTMLPHSTQNNSYTGVLGSLSVVGKDFNGQCPSTRNFQFVLCLLTLVMLSSMWEM